MTNRTTTCRDSEYEGSRRQWEDSQSGSLFREVCAICDKPLWGSHGKGMLETPGQRVCDPCLNEPIRWEEEEAHTAKVHAFLDKYK